MENKKEQKDRPKESQAEHIARKSKIIGLGHLQRHIFLCTGPKCTTEEAGLKSWEALKAGINARCHKDGSPTVARTRAECLRICTKGPIAVVYPEGTWYHSMTPEACERVIDQHLIGGQILTENLLEENPLTSPKEP